MNADSHALAVARAIYQAIRPENVVLFGSRARGDYSPDSDIDLLVLIASQAEEQSSAPRVNWIRAREASRAPRMEFYPQMPGLDLIFMSLEKFHFFQTSQNHVAGNALREGVPVNKARWQQQRRRKSSPLSSSMPDHDQWPDVQQRCRVAYRNVRALYGAVVAPPAR